jgi:alginate O-acetyltransferase complex protein AlgJ
MLAGQPSPAAPVQNPSFPELLASLEKHSVRVFDPAPFLWNRKVSTGQPVYLETDTHWRPEAMGMIAQELANFTHRPAPAEPIAYNVTAKEMAGFGDIEVMLKLPASQQIYRPQKVEIEQVTRGQGIWRQSAEADTLLLGDSFSNIFSLEAMGWGESAGFAEHLSPGAPLDCILRNSDGSFATRELLSRELARGHDRLAGKKLVIWEFAARELSFGDWKLLKMEVGAPAPSHVYIQAPGVRTVIKGTVQAVSPVPRPGSVPYKDHILAVNLVDLTGVPPEQKGVDHALVYLMSMQDNVWTSAARLRPGDQITVSLQAWGDVSEKYDKLNRSELEDPVLALEEPAWGELLPAR